MKPFLVAIIVFSLLWITGCSNGQDNAGTDVNAGSENEFPPTNSGAIKIDYTQHADAFFVAKLGQADCRVIQMKPLVEFGTEWLKEHPVVDEEQ